MVRVRYSFSSRRTGHIENMRKQKQKFPKLMKEVVVTSDIILEVLDARFVNETRNYDVEDFIKSEGKKIIYVLNKIDLVDKNLKLEEVKAKELFPYCFISCKERKGQSRLRTKIKVAVKGMDLGDRKNAQVGIIGYPNTGKSSLINLLAGRSSAKIGAIPGFTKGIQKIRLSSDILLLDTPGVIPEEEYSHIRKDAIQKQVVVGARDANKVQDPEMAVAGLLRAYPKQLEEFYGIYSDGDSEVLIEELGRKKKFLRKGGIVDIDRTARTILVDWQSGKIRI